MMSLYRVALIAGATLLATVLSSAAFAGCCGGCGGCGTGYVVTYAPAPPVVFAPPIAPPPVQYAAPIPVPPPVAPILLAPAPIAVDHWDTNGFGGWGGYGGGWGGYGGYGGWGGNGGCGCCCGHRGLFTSGFLAQQPIYIVNQGPQYSGPGIMLPQLSYSPGEGVAAPGAYPYIGRYRYGYPLYGRYAHRVYHHYWHRHRPLGARG